MAAPLGNTNGRRAKEFRDALDYALKNYKGIKKGLALREIATKLIEQALGGNLSAISTIADRLDGKPAQAITAEITRICDEGELTNAELQHIATAGSTGTAQKAKSKPEPDSVH